ncbi:MAG TPA: hypothetical protein VK173_06395 [Lacibacter sp.]|nr:hypothetical protein [Lacibacter sp.]
MKKGIMIVTVLAAWFLVKNPEYTQLVKGNKTTLQDKALVFAKTVKQDLFQFTTVHLPEVKIKTNNSKHKTQSCLLQVTDDKHLYNHEPLLIVNGL